MSHYFSFIMVLLFSLSLRGKNFSCVKNCRIPESYIDSSQKMKCKGVSSTEGVNFKKKKHPVVQEWRFCSQNCDIERACLSNKGPRLSQEKIADIKNDRVYSHLFDLIESHCQGSNKDLKVCLQNVKSVSTLTSSILVKKANWFILKDELLNVGQLVNEKRNVLLMLAFIAYRDIVVKKKILSVMQSFHHRSRIQRSNSFMRILTNRRYDDKCFLREVNFFAGGSVTPVSDIDIMVLTDLDKKCPKVGIDNILVNLERQIAIVEAFNKSFKKQFQVPSGTYLDVNLYVADKNLWRLKTGFSHNKINNQAVLASGWYALQKAVLEKGGQLLEAQSLDIGEKSHPDYNSKVLQNYAKRWIAQLEQYKTLDAQNLAYIHSMKSIKELLYKCMQNPVKTLCSTFKERLVFAMILANEAYYNPGALFFQVGLEGEEINSCQVRAGAIMQNIAYAIEHFKPEIPGGKLKEIGLLKAAKYISRVDKIMSYSSAGLSDMSTLLTKYDEEKKLDKVALKKFFVAADSIKAIKDSPNFASHPIQSFIKASSVGQEAAFTPEALLKTFIPLGVSVLRTCHKHDLQALTTSSATTGGGSK